MFEKENLRKSKTAKAEQPLVANYCCSYIDVEHAIVARQLRIADSIEQSLGRLSACYDDLVKLQSTAATTKQPEDLQKNLAQSCMYY